MEPPMRLFAAVLCLALSLSAAAAAAPGWIRPEVAYSATRTMTVGGHEISGPLHYDDGKERFEMRSEEHTSELQSLMRLSYAVFCLNKKTDCSHLTHTTTSRRTH